LVLHQVLYLALFLRGELASFSREELDTVVRVGVVRGTDDAGRRGTESGREGSDTRRGQDAEVYHVGPAAGGAGGEGAGEHLSRETRVASDEQLSSENPGGGETEAQGVLGQQALVGDPAHPVGAESCGSTFQLFSALEG
jgi:hypothetical protein